MKRKISTYIHVLALAAAVLFCALPARAFDPAIYAKSSVLASGKWAKIRVATTGMQFISNSQLSTLGFKDPAKVNVYGFGGRMIPELLTADMPDDLPQLPVVRTAKGIYFFGTDHVDWAASSATSTTKPTVRWRHTQNVYSEQSVYFLSDRETEDAVLAPAAPAPRNPERTLTTFPARTVYEKDLFTPSNTGRAYLGEDFRSPNRRSFSLSLPDNEGGDVRIRAMFGTYNTGKIPVSMTVGDKTYNDTIAPLRSADNIMNYTSKETSFKTGDNLNLEIKLQAGGTVKFMCLDYIEAEWTRALKLRDGQLHIYDYEIADRRYTVEGCSSTTQVWDVTKAHAPAAVETTLEGTRLSFNATGRHEYIVFNPDKGYAVTTAGSVANQDIHSLPAPDLLIITPSEYKTEAERLAQYRRDHSGYTVHVVTPEQLYNEFSSGSADVSAFRKAFKMWYDREGAGRDIPMHCLIMSRPTYDNKMITEAVKSAGYPRVPIWQSAESLVASSSSYSTDDFIGMVEDPKTPWNMGRERIHVAVGRMPVKSLEEARQTVDKLIRYETEPDFGAWMNDVIVIADDADGNAHIKQAEEALAAMKGAGNGDSFNYKKIYLDSWPMEYNGTGAVYPKAWQALQDGFNNGTFYIDYIGHANPKSWGHEHLLTWTDITTMTNKRLPILYAATCEFARFDDDDISGAEVMYLYPESGIIATICPSRTVYISNNGDLNTSTSSGLFKRTADGKPKTIGQVMIDGKNLLASDANCLRYAILGDPSMRLPSPVMQVRLDSIAGVDPNAIKNSADYPTIKARQTVPMTGSIVKADGTVAEDFNGTVEILLMDAEQALKTYGNPGAGNGNKEGTPYEYNDRTAQLYTGRAAVKNGRWRTSLIVPPEILNNYSPGRLTFYAYSDQKATANGASERLYVYGYDETAPRDTVGPDITLFTLNREGFTEGGISHSTPTVIARFSDPSGINLSNTGIGHSLSLLLDGKTYFTELSPYYEPDPFDHTAGSLTYTLPETSAGEHTLAFTVWDNANNSSTASISFQVAVGKNPEIITITPDCNPAKTGVNFVLATDRPSSRMTCKFEVMDLNGRTVWSKETDASTARDSSLKIQWNLTDKSGERVPRGIYLYRATLTGPEGTHVSKSERIAVTAP